MPGFVARSAEAILECLYPGRARCMGCGDLTGTEAGWLCGACRERIVELDLIDLPRCRHCGKPLSAGVRCRACADWPEPGISRAYFRYAYAAPVSGLVRSMKYHGVYRITRDMALAIGELLLRERDDKWDFVAPVPMHPSRERVRGKNGPACVARILADILNVPYADALVRARNTRQQVGKSPEERAKMASDAFRASGKVDLRGKRILVIDDVITTGTTVFRCAEALIAAGAKDVQAASYAGHVDMPKRDSRSRTE